MENNKPAFNGKEQRRIIAENGHLIERMKSAKNIDEWNISREIVKDQFKGTSIQLAMLFGYIDGMLHAIVKPKPRPKTEY